MPPIRNRNRPNRQDYDESLPENWTVNKLRQELNLKGITPPQNTRRSVLVSLYKQATNEESGHLTDSIRSHVTPSPSGPSHNGPSPSQDVRTELLGVVRDLTTTVQSLQSSMISLTERVNNMSRPQPTIPAAAGSAEQLRQTGVQNTMARVDVVSGTPREPTETENYTLSTAWADQNSTKTVGVKTTYGYSAESLPYVETISPNLRKQIVEDGQISEASTRSRQTSYSLSSLPGDHNVKDIETLWNAAISPQTARAYSTGAATSAAEAGIQDHLIQTLGRWSSNCYVRYIRTDEKVLKEAQEKMCNGK
ncbi:uncharacterized protein LOC134264068 isoform X2 [Saccostrea cucullata]|uniref:uncharacterized protein LOC134258986 n=1 Tax=Saccostrea cuccullata TaxID=36930 RepID=UPI002ED3C3D7